MHERILDDARRRRGSTLFAQVSKQVCRCGGHATLSILSSLGTSRRLILESSRRSLGFFRGMKPDLFPTFLNTIRVLFFSALARDAIYQILDNRLMSHVVSLKGRKPRKKREYHSHSRVRVREYVPRNFARASLSTVVQVHVSLLSRLSRELVQIEPILPTKFLRICDRRTRPATSGTSCFVDAVVCGRKPYCSPATERL
ncbi:hypothetical protein DBV15_10740 [Temnothorax longispinosus]|uniref:Uncharacterized protein n=1 Tax=Temnothorax longispinosus TaxID=300112 RepID=A0A4V3SCG9_9HYME|nr:hypothetical protein DBV15_10740 [Temnothorax longispinosus]